MALDANDVVHLHGADALRATLDVATKGRPELPYVDIARDPIPPREWAVPGCIPARNVALISGEGGKGKSILLMQLCAATVIGRDWIGTMPTPGPSIYLSAEEDDDEVRRRFEAVGAHYGVSRSDLHNGGLHTLAFAGMDATLGYADRTDHIKPTPLFEKLQRDARLIRPRLIVLDTVADVFDGKENDRAQTRQFITMLRRVAIEIGATIILASHPSLTGIATGTGLSGSTAWHNSIRARAYFQNAPGIEDDDDLRVLEWHKNNYGRMAERTLLRWRDGVYVPEPRTGSLEKMAADRKVDDLFLDLLRRFTKQGRNVSDKRSPTYAPALFAEEPEAKAAKVNKLAFAEAMTRLFAMNKLRIATEGSASRQRSKIAEVET